MSDTYHFTLTFYPEMIDTRVENPPGWTRGVDKISIKSKKFESFADTIGPLIETLQGLVKNSPDSMNFHDLTSMNPSLTAAREILKDFISSDEKLKNYGASDIKFSPGEVIKMWVFDETGNINEDGSPIEQQTHADAVAFATIFITSTETPVKH